MWPSYGLDMVCGGDGGGGVGAATVFDFFVFRLLGNKEELFIFL